MALVLQNMMGPAGQSRTLGFTHTLDGRMWRLEDSPAVRVFFSSLVHQFRQHPILLLQAISASSREIVWDAGALATLPEHHVDSVFRAATIYALTRRNPMFLGLRITIRSLETTFPYTIPDRLDNNIMPVIPQFTGVLQAVEIAARRTDGRNYQRIAGSWHSQRHIFTDYVSQDELRRLVRNWVTERIRGEKEEEEEEAGTSQGSSKKRKGGGPPDKKGSKKRKR
jgi:hypothetical protein